MAVGTTQCGTPLHNKDDSSRSPIRKSDQHDKREKHNLNNVGVFEHKD